MFPESEKIASIDQSVTPEDDRVGYVKDVDNQRLESMGYHAELNRNFSVLSVLAIGFSITNSWFGVTGALVTGLSNGGPVIYIWGLIGVGLIHLCVASSLSELASAYPNAAGQYFWVSQLAPKRAARFASYITGAFSWAGAMFTGASVALVIGQGVVGLIILKNPEVVYQPWMGFVGYQVANIFVFFWNCHERFLPMIGTASLWLSLISMVTILITVLAVSPTKQPASFVFTGFINDSGWGSDGIAYITGLIGVNWGFSCLDAATHMAEEIPQPERNIPKAVIGTVIIGLVTTLPYDIAIFFSVQSIADVISTPTFVPSLELFRQALNGSVNGAIVLQMLVIFTACGCLFAIHTWECRLAWAFSRDKGFPLHKWLSRVAPQPYGIPFWAHVWSCFWIAVLGCLYLASSTGFNSLVTGCILLQYISYCIPIGFLMARKRRIVHGPFWLGNYGWFVNIVTMSWGLFTLVLYSFPYVYPTEPGTANYVTVVMGIFFIYAIGYWFVKARKGFTIPPASEHLF